MGGLPGRAEIQAGGKVVIEPPYGVLTITLQRIFKLRLISSYLVL